MKDNKEVIKRLTIEESSLIDEIRRSYYGEDMDTIFYKDDYISYTGYQGARLIKEALSGGFSNEIISKIQMEKGDDFWLDFGRHSRNVTRVSFDKKFDNLTGKKPFWKNYVTKLFCGSKLECQDDFETYLILFYGDEYNVRPYVDRHGNTTNKSLEGECVDNL